MSRLTKWPFGGAVLSTAHFSKAATMEFFHQVARKKTLRLRNETRGDADISFQRVVAGAGGGAAGQSAAQKSPFFVQNPSATDSC